MNNQQPIRIIIETGKEHREGQLRRERKLRRQFIATLLFGVSGCGYIYYLFYQAVHP